MAAAFPKVGDFVTFKSTGVLGCVVRVHDADGIDVDVGPDVPAASAVASDAATARAVDAFSIVDGRTVRVASGLWTAVLAPFGVADRPLDLALPDVPGGHPAVKDAAVKKYKDATKKHAAAGKSAAPSPAGSPRRDDQHQQDQNAKESAPLTLSESLHINRNDAPAPPTCPAIDQWLWSLFFGPLYGVYKWHSPVSTVLFLYFAWLLQTWADSGASYTFTLLSLAAAVFGVSMPGRSSGSAPGAAGANATLSAVSRISGVAMPSAQTVSLVHNVVRIAALFALLSATPLHEADLKRASVTGDEDQAKERDAKASSRRHAPAAHWIASTTASFAKSMKVEFWIRAALFATYGALSAYCGGGVCPAGSPGWLSVVYEKAVAPMNFWDFAVTQVAVGVIFGGVGALAEARRRAGEKPKPLVK